MNINEYTPEQIKNSEQVRRNIVLQSLENWSDLHEKMNDHYMDILAKYQAERREMYKYLGTIAGGAAALAPQLIDSVKQLGFFYTGISLLCLTVIVSVTYVLSTLENDCTILGQDLKKKNEMIYWLRKPKIDFLTNQDYSVEAFGKAMSEKREGVPDEDEKPDEKKGWFKQMDYTSEFVILFTVGGLGLLVLSLTDFCVSYKLILLVLLLVFIVINIISSFPKKVFSYLGFPIDLIKSAFRIIFKLK